jgi:hypothetical protein
MKHTLSSPPRIKLDVQPTARELRWFAHIDRHGPQSSGFLYEWTRDTHKCRDTALRRLQALREAGYLRLPPQQRQIAKADFNPYVYDLTRLGWDILAAHKGLEKHCRPYGHWWHGYWVSAVSSAIEISAVRAGHTYIPAAQILAIKGVEMGIPVSGSKVIPDQLFAIKYADGYRAFALEVDRGTEPVQSGAARKSLQRSVALYQQLTHEKLYQSHFGLKSKLCVLWVFQNEQRMKQFSELLYQDEQRFAGIVASWSAPRWSDLQSVAQRLRIV